MFARSAAVLGSKTLTTDLTCNCLLPCGGGEASAGLLTACYELNSSSGNNECTAAADSAQHVGGLFRYGSCGEEAEEKGVRTATTATTTAWGTQAQRRPLPGVFDVTWTGARAFFPLVTAVTTDTDAVAPRGDPATGGGGGSSRSSRSSRSGDLPVGQSQPLRLPRHLLLSACTDGSVRLSDPRTLVTVRTFASIHDEMLTSCTPFLPSSLSSSSSPLHLLCTAHTGAVLVYSVAEERVVHRLEGHEFDAWCGAVMPTAHTTTTATAVGETRPVCDASQPLLLSGGDDGLMKLYDMRAGYAACGRARFDAGVIHIAPVVSTTRTVVSSGPARGGGLGVGSPMEVVSGPTPYVLVGSYDESISLMDTRFLKRPVARREGLGGGVWRCNRCIFPFYPSHHSDTSDGDGGTAAAAMPTSNLALAEACMAVENSFGWEEDSSVNSALSPAWAVYSSGGGGVVSEANTLVLPLMQRGAALLSYNIRASEDRVFGAPRYFYKSNDADDSENDTSALTDARVSGECIVYDAAVLGLSGGGDGVTATARIATCSFYEKRIDVWSVEMEEAA